MSTRSLICCCVALMVVCASAWPIASNKWISMSDADATVNKLAAWTFSHFNVSDALAPITIDGITGITYKLLDSQTAATYAYEFTAVISYPKSTSTIEVDECKIRISHQHSATTDNDDVNTFTSQPDCVFANLIAIDVFLTTTTKDAAAAAAVRS